MIYISIMADISKRDNSDESSMVRCHNDMNVHIYGGGNVSHILNVIINEQTTSDAANQIRQQVFHKINNVPIKFNIQQLDVVITWRSKAISNHYHADVMGIYGDNAVKLHTEMLLRMFDTSAYGDCLGGPTLDFIVTKPLVRTIPL
jgi:hypothetical protein